MSDFSNKVEGYGQFSSIELDSGVDFSNNLEVNGQFSSFELDEGVDFYPTGDAGIIVYSGTGFGEGPFGYGPFGGSVTYTMNYQMTQWTNIDTP